MTTVTDPPKPLPSASRRWAGKSGEPTGHRVKPPLPSGCAACNTGTGVNLNCSSSGYPIIRDPTVSRETSKVTEATFVFIAIDEKRRPRLVPPAPE